MFTHRFFASDRTPLCADVYEPEAAAAGAAGGAAAPGEADGDRSRGQAPVVCIVHGYCEHRGRYRATASVLAREGFRVVVPDLRGHGESGGPRAHVLRFRDYLNDLEATLRTCVREAGLGSGPPLLIGHSMGGLVATLYALERPGALRALVLSSPFFGLKMPVPVWKQALGRLASRLSPGLTLPNEIDPAHLSHDASVVQAYAADALVSRVATARWFTEALAAQAEVRRRARALQLPVLLLHAGDDRIADPRASQCVFGRIGASDKVFTLYPGLFHEIFNEREREHVLQDLIGWLKVH